MLCHDRQIDRRIIAQAKTLIAHGHHVRLFALSEDSKDSIESFEGIVIHRIHFARVFVAEYNSQTNQLSHISHKILQLGFSLIFKFPLLKNLVRDFYKFIVKSRYALQVKDVENSKKLVNFLYPFKRAFIEEAGQYDFDLIQVHDLPLLETGVELAEKNQVPLVFDAHELYPEQLVFKGVFQKALSIQESCLIKKCSQVFTVNQSIALEMQQRYDIPLPTVLLNALDALESTPALEKQDFFRKHFSIALDTKVVLLQGHLAKHRNLEELVKAFSFIKNLKIVLVVMGSGELGPKLLKIAKKYDLLNKSVYFLPKVPQQALLEYTSAADLGIIPYPALDLNTYYCTPNKLFEFIQAGLPIVANDLPELRRYVQDTGFGMVHPMASSQDIAKAIELAVQKLRDSHWQQQIRQNAHLYSWQCQSQVYWQAMRPFLSSVESKDSYDYCRN